MYINPSYDRQGINIKFHRTIINTSILFENGHFGLLKFQAQNITYLAETLLVQVRNLWILQCNLQSMRCLLGVLAEGRWFLPLTINCLGGICRIARLAKVVSSREYVQCNQ